MINWICPKCGKGIAQIDPFGTLTCCNQSFDLADCKKVELPSCYNCSHHSLCKYEPAWTTFPTKNEDCNNKWYDEVPCLIAQLCAHYKEKKDGN